MTRKTNPELSEKHVKILECIANYLNTENRPPSIREIGEKVGITSTSVVNYDLDQLDKRGYLSRDNRVSRGLRLAEKVGSGLFLSERGYNAIEWQKKPLSARKLRIFLCHATADKPAVQEIWQRLGSESWIDPWLDKEKILPGQEWESEIEKAVENSDVIITFLSCNAVNKKGYVQRELRYALSMALEMPEETIFLIPFRLEQCQVPRSLQKFQWVDYFDESNKEKVYEKLIESLRARYDQIIQQE